MLQEKPLISPDPPGSPPLSPWVVLHEKGESFYNEYIPAVITHLDETGFVTLKENVKLGGDGDDGGAAPPTRGQAKVIFPPNSKHEHPLIVQKSDGGYGYVHARRRACLPRPPRRQLCHAQTTAARFVHLVSSGTTPRT